MNLEALSLKRSTYGENEGKIIGTIKFAGDTGKIELVLTPDFNDRLFAVVADELEAVAKEAAERLRVEIVGAKAAKP